MSTVTIQCGSESVAMNVICAAELFVCLTLDEQTKVIELIKDSLLNQLQDASDPQKAD